jgi:hypothetical protein
LLLHQPDLSGKKCVEFYIEKELLFMDPNIEFWEELLFSRVSHIIVEKPFKETWYDTITDSSGNTTIKKMGTIRIPPPTFICGCKPDKYEITIYSQEDEKTIFTFGECTLDYGFSTVKYKGKESTICFNDKGKNMINQYFSDYKRYLLGNSEGYCH